jgi:hypothetical protein
LPLKVKNFGSGDCGLPVLLALLAVAQVVHAHPVQSDADHCPLCIAMHSVVPIVVMVAALVLVRIETVACAMLGDGRLDSYRFIRKQKYFN